MGLTGLGHPDSPKPNIRLVVEKIGFARAEEHGTGLRGIGKAPLEEAEAHLKSLNAIDEVKITPIT